MTIREAFENEQPKQYHIFDSHQEGMDDRGVKHADRDYDEYSYNIHKNNRPQGGDAFLYRRPGKSTSNRKFNIYGGGIIDHITDADSDGNVKAKVRSPFRLMEPLEQGTSTALEEFKRTSLARKGKENQEGDWSHFWNQYGMNVIEGEDFYGLVGDLEFIEAGNTNPYNAGVREAAEEIEDIDEDFSVEGFHINIDESNDLARAPEIQYNSSTELTGRHVDFERIQEQRTSIGKAGEYLVLAMLKKQYERTDVVIEHVAQTQGDGCGYDIKMTIPDREEIRIEVKTTKEPYVDGFYLTPRELSAAKECLQEEASQRMSYHIYRVYNFDPKNKTADIKIYDHFNAKDFRLAPTCWKVYTS